MNEAPQIESARVIHEPGEKNPKLMLIINGQKYAWPIARKRLAELIASSRDESL